MHTTIKTAAAAAAAVSISFMTFKPNAGLGLETKLSRRSSSRLKCEQGVYDFSRTKLRSLICFQGGFVFREVSTEFLLWHKF